jgi:hypothetical protein
MSCPGPPSTCPYSRTSHKKNSRKFISRMLQIPTPIRAELRPSANMPLGAGCCSDDDPYPLFLPCPALFSFPRPPGLRLSPLLFTNCVEPEFYEVRLTAYWGTTATASISTKKSGCARPETNTPVIAGGLGVWGQAF